MGGCTFAVGSISWLSANPVIATVQHSLMILIFPGLLGGMAISGNAHAFSLGAAAVVNLLFYFGLCWLIFPLLLRLKRGLASVVFS